MKANLKSPPPSRGFWYRNPEGEWREADDVVASTEDFFVWQHCLDYPDKYRVTHRNTGGLAYRGTLRLARLVMRVMQALPLDWANIAVADFAKAWKSLPPELSNWHRALGMGKE